MCFCLSNSAGLFQIWTPRLKRDEVVTVRPISNANETSPFSSGLQRQKRTPEGDDPARQRRPQVTFYHFIFARPFLSCRERHSSLELSGSDCRPGQRTGQTVRDLLRRWFNQIFNSLLLLLSNCIIPLDHSKALLGDGDLRKHILRGGNCLFYCWVQKVKQHQQQQQWLCDLWRLTALGSSAVRVVVNHQLSSVQASIAQWASAGYLWVHSKVLRSGVHIWWV